MITSLSAFYHNINIGHIEAGLRTLNRRAPFPEEINRRITGIVADVHFASTERHLILISGEYITMRAELGMKNLWNTCWPDGILYL
jgi:UDP-N-acetylglucosamine 2-epimerase (non-hydrolysing)